MKKQIEHLQWDSDFFKKKIGKIVINSQNELDNIALQNDDFELIYVFSKKEIQDFGLLASQFEIKMVDKKTVFSKKTKQHLIDEIGIQFLIDKQASSKLIDLAIQSGEYSRFKTDPKIGEENFKELYKTWIKKSVSKEIALQVLVYKLANDTAGFVTLGQKNERADIGIIAVDGAFRGQGIGKKLMLAAEQWFAKQGFDTIQVVTQGGNEPACKLYKSCGFEVESTEIIYHLWQKK